MLEETNVTRPSSNQLPSDPSPTMVRTLVGNGFELENVASKPGYLLFDCHRFDEFGVRIAYTFALAGDSLGSAAHKAIKRHADRTRARLVVIHGEDGSVGSPPTMSWSSFLARFGGPIKSWLPLELTFAEHLGLLGHNQEIPGVEGRPDDLFEEYVHVGLQFLLTNRVIRYGQERRGEAVPDGVALGSDSLILLYDAKAYADGYEATSESVRQFGDYVKRFHDKYERYLGRIHSFVVISGKFRNGEQSRENQSRELYRTCSIPLAFLTAHALGVVTTALAKTPSLRLAIDWRGVFSHYDVDEAVLEKAILAARKDRIVRA